MEPDTTQRLSATLAPEVQPVAAGRPFARASGQARADSEPGWLRFLDAARPQDYRIGFYAFAALLLMFFLLLTLQGPCLQVEYGHDDPGFLNNAWKVYCGVWPHADYHSAPGPLNPWIYAAGIWLLGPTAEVLPFCNALVAVALGLLAWTVAKPRLTAFPSAAFACTQMIVAMTPHALRFDWSAATYAGYYNRQGYALVSILMLTMFLPRRENSAPAARRDGVVAGAILGVLLFLKISYFMAGGGLCVLALVRARRYSWPLLGGVLIGGGLTVAACLPLIRFNVVAMLDDLRMAAGARTGAPEAAFSVGHYLHWLLDAWLETILLAVMQFVVVARWLIRRRPPAPNDEDSMPLGWPEFGGVVMASAFLCMTNAQLGSLSETPLLGSWLFVLAGTALAAPRASGRQADANSAGEEASNLLLLGIFSCGLWIIVFSQGFLCLCWSAQPWRTAWQRRAMVSAPAFDCDSMADLRIVGWAGEGPRTGTYTQEVNDGLELLRNLDKVHRVEAFDFVNPFPFALQWPAARGGMWCWHNGYSFSETSHPTPQEAFGDADILMVPKYPGTRDSYKVLYRVYRDFVATHFELVGESAQWYMLRRK